MQTIPTSIPDVLIIEPKVFGDARGFFYESFNAKRFAEVTGVTLPFVQDNHSKSAKGVLRGLHYQEAPKAQGKFVRVVAGSVFDVVVDIRKDSETFGVMANLRFFLALLKSLLARVQSPILKISAVSRSVQTHR